MKFVSTALFLAIFALSGFAQKAEVTISLNEAFFDSALEALFTNGAPLEFSIATANTGQNETDRIPSALSNSFSLSASGRSRNSVPSCSETIRIQREVNGVRTSVRFREGKILAPLAFSGNYNPPFVGCVPFSGWAESVIDLEFEQNAQRLVARARVLNVNLNGTGGLGGTVVARLVQSSIDKKVNPIELFQLDKLSFAVPVRGTSGLRMRATAIRHELQNGAINVIISYEFGK